MGPDLTWFDGRTLVLLVGAVIVAFQLGAVFGYAQGWLDGVERRRWEAAQQANLDGDRKRALRVIDGGCSAAEVYDFEAER